MKERLFRMKQFSIRHSLSAMKVGVDAVLLGAWADIPQSGTVLDAGCGCGILSLMLAQRSSGKLAITAIDLDPFSVIEANQNFSESPWVKNLHALRADFSSFTGKFDLIISNPPFFNSGVNVGHNSSARELARHVSQLSPRSLIARAQELLKPDGSLAIIFAAEDEHDILCAAKEASICPERICQVSGRTGAPAKRILLQLRKNKSDIIDVKRSAISIEHTSLCYTEEYRSLTSEFYLDSTFKIPCKN